MAAALHRRDVADSIAREGRKRVTRRLPGLRDRLPRDAGGDRDPQSRAVHRRAAASIYDYIPALNARDAHADIARRTSSSGTRSGWPDADRGAERRVATRAAQERALARRRCALMLGRFLEISLHTPVDPRIARVLRIARLRAGAGRRNLVASLCRRHRRAPVPRPARRGDAVARADVRAAGTARGVDGLRSSASTFEEERLGDDVFNQAQLRDPARTGVKLLEARTFSPPQLDTPIATSLRLFQRVRPAGARRRRRARILGAARLRRARRGSAALPRTPLTSDDLDLALYRTRALRQPVLTFEDRGHARSGSPDCASAGIKVSDEMPDSLDESGNGVLVAPEGTRLLLLTAVADRKIATYGLPTGSADR